MIPPIIHSREHEPAFCLPFNEYREWLQQQQTNSKKKETLGLYEKGNGFAPGNFIGMVWFGEGKKRAVLRVDSKFPTMDYVTMYAECASHSTIGDQLNCLHVWPEQELINTRGHDFSILTVISYLRELNKFCQRHMRRHFIRERQNFVGKVKGKILIGENQRRNIIRLDRIYCEYQSVSDDILENQILRTALERAARYFAEYRGKRDAFDILPQWIRASRATLRDVSTRHVKPGDFIAARKRGAFAFYARPLALAKAVLLQLGPNPKAEISQTQTPPFALDSAKLFERYTEVKLLEDSENFSELLPESQIRSPDAGDFDVIACPDFYVRDNQTPRIIDAKYKKVDSAYFTDEKINDNKRNPKRDDINQIVTYSQHRELLRRMNCNDGDSVELGLAYPYVGGIEKSIISKKQTRAFMPPLTIYGIPCPAKKTTKKTSANDK